MGEPKITDDMKAEMVSLRMKGATLRELAKLYDVVPDTISRALNRPEAQEQMKVWRTAIRRTHLARTAEGLLDEMYDAAEVAAAKRDFKGLDAAMRAINAAEKTSFSASGEAQKIDLKGEFTASQMSPDETRGLLRSLQEHLAEQALSEMDAENRLDYAARKQIVGRVMDRVNPKPKELSPGDPFNS